MLPFFGDCGEHSAGHGICRLMRITVSYHETAHSTANNMSTIPCKCLAYEAGFLSTAWLLVVSSVFVPLASAGTTKDRFSAANAL